MCKISNKIKLLFNHSGWPQGQIPQYFYHIYFTLTKYVCNQIKYNGNYQHFISSNYKIFDFPCTDCSVSWPMHQKKRLGMLRQKRNTSLL